MKLEDFNPEQQELIHGYAIAAIQSVMTDVQPRIRMAIEEAALRGAISERQRIIQWLKDDSDGLTPPEYADVLSKGLPDMPGYQPMQ